MAPLMLKLEAVEKGVVLPVKAKAAARSNGLQGVHDGALRVAVTQAPERGKANRAIIEVLCKQLGLRKSQIALLSGEASPEKRFLIQEIAEQELQERIQAVLEDAG